MACARRNLRMSNVVWEVEAGAQEAQEDLGELGEMEVLGELEALEVQEVLGDLGDQEALLSPKWFQVPLVSSTLS